MRAVRDRWRRPAPPPDTHDGADPSGGVGESVGGPATDDTRRIGGTERGLRRLGRRYAVVIRSATLACAGGAALFQSAPERRALVGGVLLTLCAWSVLYLRANSRRWLLPVDTLLIVLLCLTQRWTVPPEALADSTNWVLAVAAITAVAHQWLGTAAGGALLATAIVLAHLAGNALASPGTWSESAPVGLWTLVEAGLSRVLFLLVRAGARQTDLAVRERERARSEAAVAAARWADEREHLAVLHDTAASTLLAVGARMVDGTEPWLAAQAGRDLATISGRPDLPDTSTDLVRTLREVARNAAVAVELRSPPMLLLPTVRASAIGAAVREALTNVGRHAGVGTAELVVRRRAGRTLVEVVDRGRGFAPERVPGQRRGLSHSIRERMARVGGRAVVTAAPGAGTRIRLEVPDG
ncbi:sensor histidine kinase [Plantactinospora sp. BC1]|uniref:sensor histidine kinase n=1 Tax=Plantactinospora sp. BC1 TaxID=2108470 RepID=UPI00131F3F8B|nr:ATP-binding protein [Plantactinospora sp. BC1]